MCDKSPFSERDDKDYEGCQCGGTGTCYQCDRGRDQALSELWKGVKAGNITETQMREFLHKIYSHSAI